jgi:hypothetical protein
VSKSKKNERGKKEKSSLMKPKKTGQTICKAKKGAAK